MARAKNTSPDEALRRGKGRPGEDGTVGKEAIVASTIELLRTRSPESLTLLEIAANAAIDPALIRYYFGNKDGLLTATVSRLMADRQEAHRALMPQQGSVEERLKRRIATGLEQQRANPNFHRMVVERIFDGQTADAREALEMTAARGLALTVGFLHAGSGDTELRMVDPRFLNLALIGMCEFFVSAQPLVETLCGQPMDDALLDSYADFVVDLIVNGLKRR
jgi:AcrR family transcriptional regulator